MKWEYLILNHIGLISDAMRMLNEQGDEGWELVSTYRDMPDYFEFVFKRQAVTKLHEGK